MGTVEQRVAGEPGLERDLEQMRWVRGLAAGLVADAGLAEDVAQETLVAAWQHAAGGAGVTRGWLATVARNVLRQHRRGESRRAVREERAARNEALPSPDELAQRMERQRLLADALTRLEEPYRSTVLLRYSEELQPSEIARRLGVPAGTVRRRLKEGLDRLRSELDGHFEGDRAAWVGALLPFFAPPTVELALAQAGVSLTWISIAGGIVVKKAVLAALVVVLAGGVFWLARGGGDDVEQGASVASAGAGAELAMDAPVAPDSGRALQGARPAEGARSAVASQPASAAPELFTLTGRVDPPRGAPDDATVEVFALREPKLYEEIVDLIDEHPFDAAVRAEWDELLLARALVGADQRFALELPDEREPVHLALRGRFLYLPATRAAELGPLASEPVLTPKLGACVAGTLKPAHDEVPRAQLAGVEVELDAQGGKLDPSDGILGREFGSELRSSADGAFEFRGLPVDREFGVVVHPETLGGARRFVEGLRAGELRALEIELEHGASITGRVRGPDGEPLAGVTVTASFTGRWFGMDRAELRDVETGADGTFELHDVGTGTPIAVQARLSGYLESATVDLTLAPREEREGIELALAHGAAVTGRVTWPDGAPAGGREVVVTFDQAHLAGERALNALRGAWTVATTDADGRFVASGLGAGPFSVMCEDERDGVRHRVRRDGVLPGKSALALVLHPPLAIEGRALDETGAPLARFRVTRTRVVPGAFGDMAFERAELLIEDPAGRFLIEDLDEGRYELYVIADAHVSEAPVTIDLPRPAGAAPVELRTLRSASVRGGAVDPDGVPIANARVRISSTAPSWQLELLAGTPPNVATTDSVGRFELDSLAPGALQLVAEADGYAPSEALDVELAPGERREGLELRLARGATLAGVVYDTEGDLAANWIVNVQRDDESDARFVTTDVRGEFLFEDMPSGKWQVVAIHMNKDWDVDEGGVDYGQLLSDLRMAHVQLAPGAREHLVLGEPPSAPVRVTGHVLQGETPRAGAMIAFQHEEGGEPVMAGVDEDGGYELVVDGGGTYNVSIQTTDFNSGLFDALDYVRDVPEVAEHRLDFALPTGRISGLVGGPDGEPVSGASVTLYADTSAGSFGEGSERLVESRTGEDGRYSVDALDPGTYVVQAGGASFLGGGVHARVTRTGVVVASGAAREDVDFRLPEPGTVEVTVLDPAGAPAAGAFVYARDPGGRLLHALSFVATDARGVARLQGIPPGDVTLFARSDSRSSQESQPVRVLPGEVERAELVLEQGTILWAQLLDQEREPLRGSIFVYDRDEREVGNAFAITELDILYQQGAFAPSRRRFGPLPPGKYTVRARTDDGTVLEKTVSLRGQDERTVTLRLRE